MAERRYAGRIAAPGLAAGPMVAIGSTVAAVRTAGTAADEAAALRAAIARATAELAAQIDATAASDPLSAEVLGLQLALMEDPVLAEPAFDAVAAGESADRAWGAAMDGEIAGYLAADDDYFRARATDLADLRDRVIDCLLGADAAPDCVPGAVLVGADLAPSRFLAIDWSRGGAIALTGGSETSHVAMLARARGVPMLVGVDPAPDVAAGQAVVDAGGTDRSGVVIAAPGADTLREFESRRAALAAQLAAAQRHAEEPARTADGTAIRILLNVADLDELDRSSPTLCDGIGLVRTEFLFERGAGLPDEDSQYAAYCRLIDWAAGRPVTIRTLDAGADKPIAGLTHDDEANPFLGVRGVRLSLQHPDLFGVQLRALARAARHGPLRVMLPMVTLPDELTRARLLLDEALARLAAAGVPHARPDLGIMVEVPAAALRAGDFDAAFYSIGSNDLTQYTAAAGRDVAALSHLLDPIQPAVLDLIALVCRAARERGVDVSLCGDAGGDVRAIPALLRAGLRSLSMAPRLVAQAKQVIARTDLE